MVVRDKLPEAIRDLLGIVRALHLARRREGASTAELERIAKVGRDLAATLVELGVSAPGSLRHTEAYEVAKTAADELGMLVAIADAAQPIVTAAQDRVRRARLARSRPRRG